ncbi:MAG: hypothetical protein RL154_1688, partial [Pseudomonadota bacterium]
MAITLAQAKTEIAKLYIATFNRIPDKAGLDYWANAYVNGASKDAIAQSFTGVKEFINKYSSTTTSSDYVEQVYKNVFGRSSDTSGKAFWTKALDGGLSKGDLLNAMVNAASALNNNDGQKLTKQVDYAVKQADAGVNTTDANAYMKSITANTDPTKATSGKVMDGYIKSATVFIDANGNGKLDAGEISTTTNALGDYSFTSGGYGQIISTGGTDVTTGKASNVTLKSLGDGSVLSPTSTMLANQSLTSNKTVSELTSSLATSTGTSADQILNYDPVAILKSTTATPEEKAAALKLQSMNVEVNNVLSVAASSLKGAGLSIDSEAVQNAIESLSAKLMDSFAANTDSTKNVFEDKSLLSSAMSDIFKSLNDSISDPTLSASLDKLTAGVDNITTAVADGNAKIDNQKDAAITSGGYASALTSIDKYQETIQDTMGSKLEGGLSSLDTLANDFSGSALDTAANDAKTGDSTDTT